MTNPDDTMRRIEEALDYYDDQWKDGREKLLATIRAALQPDAGGWGEDDDRHRANEAVRLMQQDVLERRPEGWLRRKGEDDENVLKPHEFTGRHRSYQELLDAEHERAVEAWAARFDSAMLSYSHDWGLPDEEAYKPFGVAEKQAEIRAVLNDALRLMRRQPKETTDGK